MSRNIVYNRYNYNKQIAWNAEKRVYLHESGSGETKDRNYAWTGTKEQFSNLLKERPENSAFTCMADGKEKQSLAGPLFQERLTNAKNNKFSHSFKSGN